MADNASGLVNAQDASGHGAAVIYPSSKISASDYFVTLNDRLGAEKRKRDDEHAKIMAAKDAAATKDFNAQGWTPFQSDINNHYKEWQQLAGQYQTEKDYNRKQLLKQAMDIKHQQTLNSVKTATENYDAYKEDQKSFIEGKLSPEAQKNFLSWQTKTDAVAGKDFYTPSKVMAANKYNEANKDFIASIKLSETGDQVPQSDKSIKGWTAKGIDPIALKAQADNFVKTDPRIQEQRNILLQSGKTPQEVDEAISKDLVNSGLAAYQVNPTDAPHYDKGLKKSFLITGKKETYKSPPKETQKDKDKQYSGTSTTYGNADFMFGLVKPATKEHVESHKGINVDVTGKTQGNETEITINSKLKGKNAIHDFGNANDVYDAKTLRPVDIENKNGIPKSYATRTIDGKQVGGVIFEIPETKKTVSVKDERTGVTESKKVTDTPQQYVFVPDNEVLTDVSSKYGSKTPNQILQGMRQPPIEAFGDVGAQEAISAPKTGVVRTSSRSGGTTTKTAAVVQPKQQTAPKAAGTTKLTGKIDPTTLKKGSKYEVNGTVYTWNGSNLE